MEQFVFVAVVVTPTTITTPQWLDILTQYSYERRTPLLHIWPWAIGYYAVNHYHKAVRLTLNVCAVGD